MTLLSDIRLAVRGLLHVPAFTAAAIVSLTLGIATSAVVFGLVDAALLRPLPFAGSDRLMMLNITQTGPTEGEQRQRWSWQRFQLLRENVTSFADIASHSNVVLTLTGVAEPMPVPVEVVSSRYLTMLQAPLVMGVDFSASDEVPGAPPSVVLSNELWRRRFNAATNVTGREVSLNGTVFTISGVAGPGFNGLSGLAQAWIPVSAASAVSYLEYLTTNQNFISVTGRLRPDVSVDVARAEVRSAGERIHSVLPSEADTAADRFAATVMPINEARIDVVTRRGLMMLTGAVIVLLLIACANVASLLLGRGVVRRHEIAIRQAIGAGRGRIVRQLLVESTVLAGVSSFFALIVAAWSLGAVRIPATLARGRNFFGALGEFATPTLDWRVISFVVLVGALTTLIFGLVPALRTTRADISSDLRSGAYGLGGSASAGLREAIVALELGLAVVLVVGCGLLLASYSRLVTTPLGFEPDRILTFMIRPPEVRFPPAAASALIDRVLEEISRVPGVDAVTADGCAPLTMQCATAAMHIVGRPLAAGVEAPVVSRHYVAPAHFQVLGAAILRGRAIETGDRAGRPNVVVINEEAARRFWPNADPIGQRVWFEGAPAFGSPDDSAEIVGVARDVAYRPLDEEPIQPGFFTPYAQFTYATRMVLVRAQSDPRALVGAVATAVRRADPDLALFDVQTMNERARLSWSKQSAQTTLLLVIAGIALTLAATGVYAVTAFYVASTRREIGVRIALGASAARIARHSLARTARLGAVGGLAGMLGGLLTSQVLRAMLYDTSPLDPVVYGAAGLVLVIAFLAASYVPLRRAMQVDPVEVLRRE